MMKHIQEGYDHLFNEHLKLQVLKKNSTLLNILLTFIGFLNIKGSITLQLRLTYNQSSHLWLVHCPHSHMNPILAFGN